MKAEFDSENQPLCPDCNASLDCDSSNGRDTETMGGYPVEYYRCETCKCNWEVISGIEKRIYPVDFL